MNRNIPNPTSSIPADGVLILCRHGQSIANLDPHNPAKVWYYAGSLDVALSSHGVEEALAVGERIKHIRVDDVFTSQLCRASMTAFLALSKHTDKRPVVWHREDVVRRGTGGTDVFVPLICRSELNERSFGLLEGVPSNLQVTPTRTQADLKRWRNGYRDPFPGGESAHDVFRRVVPFFTRQVAPLLVQGRNVLVVSHGFVLRALTKFLEGMSDQEYEAEMVLEKTDPERCRLLAPTGAPLVYRMTDISTHCFERLEGDRAFEVAQTAVPEFCR
jgi:2,3-bisphosphoglycerate-dependent phosphoglycerate mutase